jgi:hypothetical protein
MGLFQKPQKEKRGVKILVYGNSGVGKSWFALTFPRCAVIDTEDGTVHYVDNPNMALRLVTTSAKEIEDAIDELSRQYFNDIDTVVLDSETKMYENLQHSGLVVVERRARENGRNPFSEGLSQREWGKIKLVHKRINAKLINLAAKGKNVVVTAHLSEEKTHVGDEWVKVGEKYDGVKGLDFDFDIVIKLVYDKEQNRRYAVVEKDRTRLYNIGDEIDNPSFDNWKAIFEESANAPVGDIDLNKGVEQDTTQFDDVELENLITEIKAVANEKASNGKAKQVMDILTKYNVQNPNMLTDAGIANNVLSEISQL